MVAQAVPGDPSADPFADPSADPARDRFALSIHPQPVGPASRVSFILPAADLVHLGLYDAEGRLAAILLSGQQGAGAYSVPLPIQDTGIGIADRPTGVHFVKLQVGDQVVTRRAVVIR